VPQDRPGARQIDPNPGTDPSGTVPAREAGVPIRKNKTGRNDRQKLRRNVMYKFISRLVKKDEGLTTVEYAIAGTLVALAVVTAFTALGGAVAKQIQAIVAVL
jgi:pilus assembly protein Flp/PilA